MNSPVKPCLTVKVAARGAAQFRSPLGLRELEQVLGVMLEALGFAVEPQESVAPSCGAEGATGPETWPDKEPGTTLPGLSLLLIDDCEMERCNRQALDLPGPTNILSFPAAPASAFSSAALSMPAFSGSACSGGTVGLAGSTGVFASSPASPLRQELGELLLSVDTLRRESLLYWQDESEHMLRLLAHGLAHLGGCEQLGRGGLDHGAEHDKLSARAFDAGLFHLKSIRSVPYE